MPIKIVNKSGDEKLPPEISVGASFHLNSKAGKLLAQNLSKWKPPQPPANLKVQEVKGKITIKHKKTGAELHKDIKLQEVVSELPTCNIGVTYNHTKNLGNYESVRVGVSLNVPCMVGELDDNFEFAKKWCDDKLSLMIDEIEKAAGSNEAA